MTDTAAKPHARIRIVRPPNMPVIYVEGIAQMLVGFPNSRVMFSQLSQVNGEGEQKEDVHHVACELVVPTSALIEMASGILRNLGDGREDLQAAGTEWMQKVIEVLEMLPTNARPALGQKP